MHNLKCLKNVHGLNVLLLHELDLKWNFIYVNKDLSIQERDTYLKMLAIFHIEITDLTEENV